MKFYLMNISLNANIIFHYVNCFSSILFLEFVFKFRISNVDDIT